MACAIPDLWFELAMVASVALVVDKEMSELGNCGVPLVPESESDRRFKR